MKKEPNQASETTRLLALRLRSSGFRSTGRFHSKKTVDRSPARVSPLTFGKKMRPTALLLLLSVLTACVSQSALVHEVGRREAARLRGTYTHWLAERLRKVDAMDVPSDALSKEARAAGFRAGTVDSQIVALSTAEREGLIFGRPSPAEIDGLKSLGFTLEPTSESDIFRFRLKAKNEPNQPSEPTRGSGP